MEAQEVHLLAQQVLRDRLLGWKQEAEVKGRSRKVRVLAATEAELAWEELLARNAAKR